MQLINLITTLVACPALAVAKHHLGLAHTVAKRQIAPQLGANFMGVVSGYVDAAAVQSTNTSGVMYFVQLQLPSTGGPFAYHIHVNPIDSAGNCTNAGGHLDPANRTETPPCDPAAPQTCQDGDLSGKYGAINGTSASFAITDPYTSLTPGASNSILGRSIVVHAANGTRIACANLTLLSAASGYIGGTLGNMSNSKSPAGWMSYNPDATILPSIYTGSAIAQTGGSSVRAAAPFVGIALCCLLL